VRIYLNKYPAPLRHAWVHNKTRTKSRLVSGPFPTVREADCGGCCPEMGCRHMFCIVVRKAQRSRLVDFAEAA
jgi:hypothetical protein